jgi:hypothetical protein
MSDIERIVDEANALVSTYYGYEGDDKDEQVARCLTDLRRALVGDDVRDDPEAMARATEAVQVSADMPHHQRAHFILGEALKDAKLFPAGGFEPLEGAEELAETVAHLRRAAVNSGKRLV